MVEIGLAALMPGENDPFLTGITGMAMVPDAGGDILCVVTPDGGVATYRMTEGGLVPVDAESLPFTPVAGIAPGLETIEVDGQTQVVVTGAGGLWSLDAAPGGDLSDAAVAVAAPDGLPADLAVISELRLDGQSFLAGACLGSERPGLWQVAADGSLQQVDAPGAGQSGQPGLAALTMLQAGSGTYLLGAAATSQALVVWQAGPAGLTETGRIGAEDGLGVALPNVLAVAEVGGSAYALMGSAGSSSLTVVEIGPDGQPIVRDHIVDSLESRFQDIAALQAVTVEGRSFVLAAGSDDGLSVLELLPGGRLVHLAALADSAAMTLANVAALEVGLTDAGLLVAVASATEPGLTLLDIALPQGVTRTADAGGGALDGGSAGDLLLGGAGADALSGYGGDDLLSDGAGSDTLIGGAGADLFVLAADGDLDVIADFDPALDRLDLSAWVFLRSAGQLTVLERADGAEIWYGDERLILTTADGTPLDAQTLSTLPILSVDRMLPDWADSVLEPPAADPPGMIETGSNSAEFMDGGAGADKVDGNGGADTIRGGDGSDTLNGNGEADVVDGGGGDDHLDGGDGEDTLIGGQGADVLDGRDGADRMQGDDGNDTLSGHGGQDVLEGGAGNDVLSGGGGADTLTGGAGADLIEAKEGYDLADGGEGDDTLMGNAGQDTLQGGGGADSLNGGEAFDLLLGGDGADTLEGKASSDTLQGGAGADVLSGGDGHDVLEGEGGDDALVGGPGADLLEGGDGADLLEGKDNYDTLQGGDGADTLWGGNGHDTLSGGGGDDSLLGGPGGDLMAGDDGADWMDGREGGDTLDGGAGADILFGGKGDDRLDGGGGDDWLEGGAGADVFVFSGGADSIADFDPGADRLEIEAGLERFFTGAEAVSGATILDFGSAGVLTLEGVVDAAGVTDALLWL